MNITDIIIVTITNIIAVILTTTLIGTVIAVTFAIAIASATAPVLSVVIIFVSIGICACVRIAAMSLDALVAAICLFTIAAAGGPSGGDGRLGGGAGWGLVAGEANRRL